MVDAEKIDLVEAYSEALVRYYESEERLANDPSTLTMSIHLRALDRLFVLRGECSRFGRLHDAVSAPSLDPAVESLVELVDAGQPLPKVYPYEEGDTVVLGPEIFASADGTVISWKGENYRRADAAE